MAAVVKTSSPILVAAAWAIVILPTAWGLKHTVQNAMALFHHPASATTPATSPAK